MSGIVMGAYGAYVWTCFALAAVVLVICDWRARVRQRQVYRDIEVRIKALGPDNALGEGQ
jgi:heme exporter protein CcmD